MALQRKLKIRDERMQANGSYSNQPDGVKKYIQNRCQRKLKPLAGT
jgi:hypothetical protein